MIEPFRLRVLCLLPMQIYWCQVKCCTFDNLLKLDEARWRVNLKSHLIFANCISAP